MKKKIWIILLLSALLVLSLAGCGKRVSEVKGNGFFRDVNFGMSFDEVIAAEQPRTDTGDPDFMEEYSCLHYPGAVWDGYDTDLYYLANADQEHIDTILVMVRGKFDFAHTKDTLISLYTDGSKPEQNDSEYFVWSCEDYMITVQSNEDGTAIVVLMSADAVDLSAVQ